ncbi:MAG: AAA family ATPase [Anaerolineae bacterium]|nr:AAA family ATPase [Anaerolineae bacterium]MDW8069954.1 AAA family ATPase [Anaerolineae bacterium]
MALVYCVANQKGGVGKTTTVVNVGDYLTLRGYSVLVVDVDPQANATSSLGMREKGEGSPGSDRLTIYEVLINERPIGHAIRTTRRPRLHVVPSAPALAGAEVELVGLLGREMRLRRALAPILHYYDYILIDTPPSLGLLTVNALTASRNGVIIPVQCEYLALEGLSHLLHTIDLVRQHLNPQLKVAGVVLTMYDSRTRLSQEVVQEVRKFFQAGEVFQTIVPRNVRLSEAPSFGETIFTYAPESTGAMAYAALAEELLARAPQPVRERGGI